MKLKEIRVKKLFGVFDHKIPINVDDNITIIHGPNGLGKTTLLNMIHSFFSLNFIKLSTYPFHEFTVDFDDGSTVFVINKSEQNKNSLSVIYKSERGKSQHYSPTFNDEANYQYPLHAIEAFVPGIDQVGNKRWRYSATGELLSLSDVINRFGEYLPIEFTRQKDAPAWLMEIKNCNPIQYIKTERLILSRDQDHIRRNERRVSEHSVAIYASELAKEIKSKLADYGALSQSLDRTFPARLVRLKHLDEISNETLLKKLDEIEAKRKKLIKLGLLDNNTDLEFKVNDNEIDNRTRSVLSIYIKDTQDKLDVFNTLASKIDLLKRIVKSRFRHKEMIIDKENGITFMTSVGEKLNPMSLSSGEQHQIVLLYELLFKIKEESLILIDEPELSLHVAWQVQFLRDLEEITKVVPFDVLIATHSPQIINDRWDLTVALDEEEDQLEEERDSITLIEDSKFQSDWDELDRMMEDLLK